MRRALFLSTVLLGTAHAHTVEDDPYIEKTMERNLSEFAALLEGTYTNEEQVYFEGELGKQSQPLHNRHEINFLYEPDQSHFVYSLDGERVSTFELGVSNLDPEHIQLRDTACTLGFKRQLENFTSPSVDQTDSLHATHGGSRGTVCSGLRVTLSSDGLVINREQPAPAAIRNLPEDFMPQGEYRRAAPFTCWVAPQKRDGTYAFINNIQIHDGGGRQWIKSEEVEGDDFDTVGIRMRHVRWPNGNNRDSLVLYVHKGEDSDWNRAEAYTWTGPESDRVALNLRWVQISCTRGGDTVTPSLNLKTGSGSK